MTEQVSTQLFLSYVWYKSHRSTRRLATYAEFVDECVMPVPKPGEAEVLAAIKHAFQSRRA